VVVPAGEVAIAVSTSSVDGATAESDGGRSAPVARAACVVVRERRRAPVRSGRRRRETKSSDVVARGVPRSRSRNSFGIRARENAGSLWNLDR
jgi:hypothetical protein